MSNRTFFLSLAGIIVGGIALNQFFFASRVPDLPVAEHIQRAEELHKQGQSPRAVLHLDAAVRKEPRNIRALTLRAAIRANNPDLVPALVDVDSAIRYSTGPYRDGHVLRAYIYRNGGKFKEALKDANRAIELDSTMADGYFLRSLIYQLPGNEDLAKAKQDFEKAVSIDPGLRAQTETLMKF